MSSVKSSPPFVFVAVAEAGLGLLFLAGLGVIATLPVLSAELATYLPEFADLRVPLLAISMSITVLGLVALKMIALLVYKIHRGTMPTRLTIASTDVLVTSISGMIALIVVAFFVISHAQAGNPAIALAQVLSCVALLVLAGITLVLRSRLRTAMRSRAPVGA